MDGDPLGLSHLPERDFVVISPYLVDPATTKKVNIGDGFILDSSLKLIGARPLKVLSSRCPISPADLDLINSSRLLLVAGANSLKTSFEITPGFTPAALEKIKVPVALCGIGHYGSLAETAAPLDAPSQAVIREITTRFPFVSVRCNASYDYLVRSLPDRATHVLNTSCPVAFSVDGIDRGFAPKDVYDQFVFTLTDRAALKPQARLMEAAVSFFQAHRRVLALHQDYGNARLREFAERLGYEVVAGPGYEAFLDLYAGTDLHLGNRVHAHLKCLSNGVRTFLTPCDLRQAYFAKSLDFPLITAAPSAAFLEYDFGRARAKIDAAAPAMARFLGAVRAVLDGAPSRDRQS